MKSLKTNALLNGIKQCCAILFPLITFPYISQVLGSEGYGRYSFAYSISSYFLLIAAFGISTYGIREGAKIRDDKERITHFVSQLFSINILTVIISYILLFVVIAFSTKVRSYALLILVQSLAMILAAVGTDWVNNIYEDFLYITLRYIFLQILSLILMFLFVRTSKDVMIYCVISVLASSGGNLLNIFYVRRYVKIRFTLDLDFKKHLVPLAVLFVNSLAISVYVSSDITILGFFYNDEMVGIYSFASKIYSILKQLVNAVVIVSVPRIAYVVKNRKEEYKKYVNKIFWGLMLVLVPISAGVAGMSETIISIAGGSSYIYGSSSLKILGIALIFAICSSLFTNCVLIVNNQEKKCLIATCISALTNIILNLILLPFMGIIGAAITTIIAEFANCMIQVYYSKDYLKWKELNKKPVYICLIGGILILIICRLVNMLLLSKYVKMIIAIIGSACIYLIILIIFRHPIVIDFLVKLKSIRKTSN